MTDLRIELQRKIKSGFLGGSASCAASLGKLHGLIPTRSVRLFEIHGFLWSLVESLRGKLIFVAEGSKGRMKGDM